MIYSTMPTSSWDVVCKGPVRTFWWLYVFNENKTVTWKDEHNGRHGSGTWKTQGGKLITHWYPSTTVETWDGDIDSTGWTGTCKMQSDPGVTYEMSARLRNIGKDTTNMRVPPPEGQADSMACWAASLAWWTSAMPGVTGLSQGSILGSGSRVTLRSGSITSNALMTFYASASRLRADRISPDKLEGYIKAGRLPMIIGFASGPLGGHVNVIHTYNAENSTVGVMEPWYPDPEQNKKYTRDDSGDAPVYVDNDGKAFRFLGAHLIRPISYYASRPLEGGFVVAYDSAGGPIILP